METISSAILVGLPRSVKGLFSQYRGSAAQFTTPGTKKKFCFVPRPMKAVPLETRPPRENSAGQGPTRAYRIAPLRFGGRMGREGCLADRTELENIG
jgi:hypothetical protein